MSVSAPARRRERPYLLWLQRSRDAWKKRAVAARTEVRRLRRQARSLAASRDRWHALADDLRCRLDQESASKKAPRS